MAAFGKQWRIRGVNEPAPYYGKTPRKCIFTQQWLYVFIFRVLCFLVTYSLLCIWVFYRWSEVHPQGPSLWRFPPECRRPGCVEGKGRLCRLCRHSQIWLSWSGSNGAIPKPHIDWVFPHLLEDPTSVHQIRAWVRWFHHSRSCKGYETSSPGTRGGERAGCVFNPEQGFHLQNLRVGTEIAAWSKAVSWWQQQQQQLLWWWRLYVGC